MKEIRTEDAAFEIHRLAERARESVSLFAPDGWRFFSFENYGPMLSDIAELGLNTRFLFDEAVFTSEWADRKSTTFGTACDIRFLSSGANRYSYILIDKSYAIEGRYRPWHELRGRLPTPYLSFDLEGDENIINRFVEHFEGAWQASAELQTLFVTPIDSKSEAITDNRVEVVSWIPRLSALAKNPSDLYRLSPRNFEELVRDLLREDGFTATLTPHSRDGGYDVLAYRSLITGPSLWLVECKRYLEQPVRVNQVRELLGTVSSEGASNGLIVTTSSFTKPARRLAKLHHYRISLKEYDDLVTWIRQAARGITR